LSELEPLRAPVADLSEVAEYVASPRAKPHFQTVLSAHNLFDADTRSRVTTTVSGSGADRRVVLATVHTLKTGSVSETLELRAQERLAPLKFERQVLDAEGVACREERVDFTRGPLKLPDATYPEVLLPFLLRWQPVTSGRHTFCAWIVDRFVAKVYFEFKGTSTIEVPAGKFDVVEATMYPDLNDWVSLGAILTTMAKPLLPRYRMWFERAAPHKVVRFEGAYGPPGAPEIVLELKTSH
jgi:hypothetical protein